LALHSILHTVEKTANADVHICCTRLANNIKVQYDILERRLSEKDQKYIALPDRPTIADIANIPFVTEELALKAGLRLGDWPHLQAWSEGMLARSSVQKAFSVVQTFGHD
jgi:glutathione S-transferase